MGQMNYDKSPNPSVPSQGAQDVDSLLHLKTLQPKDEFALSLHGLNGTNFVSNVIVHCDY